MWLKKRKLESLKAEKVYYNSFVSRDVMMQGTKYSETILCHY